MPAFRTAVIGCGFFGRFHLHSWRDLKSVGVQLSAICDADPARAEAAATEFGVPNWYSDPAAMLATESLDLVDIATRMDTHRKLVEMSISAGIPTVVQKPMAPRWLDCVAMVDTASKAGIFFAVHENFRFQTSIVRVREILTSGEIGTPSWARIAFRTGVDVYKNQPYFLTDDRLVILDLGVHLIDLARVLVGEVKHVTCETQRRNDRVRAEDTATIMLRHHSNAVSIVECTFENRRTQQMETAIEIEGSEGGLELTTEGAIVVVSRAGTRREAPQMSGVPWAIPPLHVVHESVLATCRHMLEAVRAGSDAQTSGRDNLKTCALVEAAYQAAASGRAVAPALGTGS